MRLWGRRSALNGNPAGPATGSGEQARALANLLHAKAFRTALADPASTTAETSGSATLQNLIDQCLMVGDSHALPLTNLTPEMQWYYGRTSITANGSTFKPSRSAGGHSHDSGAHPALPG